MKKRSHITIAVVTAALTFGSLFVAKGGMYMHHYRNHENGCEKFQKDEKGGASYFNKSEDGASQREEL